MKLKDFLRIGRTQTVPASLLLLSAGFLVGGGELFSWLGLFVVFLGFASHIASFGHNSVMDSSIVPDLESGETVDQSDDAKQHHPIISGEVSLREAHVIFHPILSFLVIFAGLVSILYSKSPAYPTFALLIWVTMGYAYNNGMSIFSIWKWFFISSSFTGLFFYSYFLASSTLSVLPILVGVYIFLRVWIQNGYEGELKDIDAPETNMLEKLGARIVNGVFISSYAKYYGGVLTALEIVVGLCIIYIVPFTYSIPSLTTFGVGIFLLVVGMMFSVDMLYSRVFNREKELKYMGACEIAFIYALMVFLLPVIGYVEGILLMAFGVLWFYGMNRWLWGTDHPAV